MTATSSYSPTAPQPKNIYFQVDTTNGTWKKAVNTGNTATTLTASAYTGILQNGIHIIYFFAGDGSEATSINPFTDIRISGKQFNGLNKKSFDERAPETSSIIGGINAYLFLIVANPTAASVSISGRVLIHKDTGLSKAKVILTDAAGNLRTTVTSSFGYYKFEGVDVGQTVVLSVSSKWYQFAPKVLNVTEDIEGFNLAVQW